MFKQIAVELPGFKYSKVFVKELSVLQLNKVYKQMGEDDTDIDLLLTTLKFSLVDEAGKCIISDDYTLDQFADEIPQSQIVTLSEAYAKLNADSDLDIAKKS